MLEFADVATVAPVTAVVIDFAATARGVWFCPQPIATNNETLISARPVIEKTFREDMIEFL